MLGWAIKSSTVSYRRRDRRFYLHCQIEARTPEPVCDSTVLGIDRGIVNVAVCSDTSFFNDGRVKNARGKYARLRASLQSTGTRSAKRKLRRMAGRERRFVTDINHIISKQIVASFTAFALEDLTKIRVKQRRSADFNRKLNSWSFYELEQFLRYKAEGPSASRSSSWMPGTPRRSAPSVGHLQGEPRPVRLPVPEVRVPVARRPERCS